MTQANGDTHSSRENGNEESIKSKMAAGRSISASLSFSKLNSVPPLGVPKRTAEVADALEMNIQALGGDKPIHSVLVANNGLAAVKFIRSVRSWAYKNFGNERAVNLIAMATPEDMKADAEHIRMADQFIEVPGGSNANNYANVQLILGAALRTGVDAVWPGWGHASEKPELPEALAATQSGIRFIGPPAGPMAALGDKVGSTILAQAAGVPTLPWSGDGVAIHYSDCPGGVIPEDIYTKACVRSMQEALECCARIGYPAMLKASWGGGGKGIRRVMNDEEVKSGFRQVQGEVPGSPIFVMKLAPQSRHLEVQLLCDMHGNVCSVFSRDCSVQRRHQKIVEEGPVTAASKEVLDDMERCARALARSVGYVGAATVEYLYALESKEYCFLELNPRLQVEHPVTEWISGVNIPAAQLMVASGIPLHRIPDIRRMYGLDPAGDSPINFEEDGRMSPSGHVVAVRVTAENANDGFKPTSGQVEEISFRSTPDVWGYFSVKSGGAIHEFSDSQFGHLFAKGESRQAAIRAMVVALKEIKVRGEIRTIVDYVCDMIQTDDFVNNLHHTGWLDARIAAQITAVKPPWYLSVISGAALRSLETVTSLSAEFLSYLERGQLPPSRLSLVASTEEFVVDGVKYRVRVSRTSHHGLRLILGGSSVDVLARRLNDGGLLVQVDGAAHVVHWEEEALGTRLLIDTTTALLSNEHDPSRVLAISTGKLLRYLVDDGAHVHADQPYAELEVMKMVLPLLAPATGHVHFQLPEGSVLSPGQLIARLDLDNPDAIRKADLYSGSFPEMGPPGVASDSLASRFATAFASVKNILAGFEGNVDAAVGALLAVLDDPTLAFEQWNEIFAATSTRLPPALSSQLEMMASTCASAFDEAQAHGDESPNFCSERLIEVMESHIEGAEQCEKTALKSLLDPLLDIARKHSKGPEAYARSVAIELIEDFLKIEEKFETGGKSTEQEVIDALRQAHLNELQIVLDIVLSHKNAKLKCALVQVLLNALVLPSPDEFRPQLRRLAALVEPACILLAQRAQELLEHSLLGELQTVVSRALSGKDIFPDSSAVDLFSNSAIKLQETNLTKPASIQRRSTFNEGLYSGLEGLAIVNDKDSSIDARMAMLVEAHAAVEDALASLIDHPDVTVRKRAFVTYIRRIYHPFMLHDPEVEIGVSRHMTAVWAYVEAECAYTPHACTCHGGAIVVDCLREVPQALANLDQLRARTGMSDLEHGNLHIILLARGESALVLSPEASKYVDVSVVDGYTSSDTVYHHGADCSPSTVAAAVAAQVAAVASEISAAGYTSVSVMSKRGKLTPLRTVFYKNESSEDAKFEFVPVLRDVEPPIASALELRKMTSFDNPSYSASRNRQWHVYSLKEQGGRGSLTLKRVFLRSVVHQLCKPSLLAATYDKNAPAAATAAMEELENILLGGLQEIQRIGNLLLVIAGNQYSKPDWVHLFLGVLSTLPLMDRHEEDQVAAALRAAAAGITVRHGAALRRASVAQWEVRLPVVDKSGAWRVVVSAPTGHEAGEDCVEVYRETDAGPHLMVYGPKDPVQNASLADQDVMAPYQPLERLQLKRLAARRHKTTYCYDFPAVFENALRELWASRAAAGEPHAVPPAGKLISVMELVPSGPLSFKERTPLTLVNRPTSSNDVGVVAWALTIKSPEAPQGRRIVAIANDITHASGAFGPKEDAMFRAATEYALAERLPVVYLAANSGARVGLASEVKQCLNVEWNNPEDPSKGFAYLYLTSADYESIMSRTTETDPVKVEKLVMPNGEMRWRITDVIGLEDGLGVECLSGSGSIASIYSKAFREGFTVTLVSGRTVGIGAYLARLGRRCVQRDDQPIILTGYAALNKLLGRDVYTSQNQLGGPRVMGTNGVSHHIVEDDLAGVLCVLNWLSYTAPRIGDSLPELSTSDPPTRTVEYAPTEPIGKLDARAAIAGETLKDGHWVSGMFDKGTWTEAQAGWARTVITGRARLDGIPVGIVAVEVNTVMLNLPADPGMPDSSERVLPQAGQVWFPDSALKTAQAIEEFDLEGLPLFILANWRGFSGGMRDLFEGVLQAGSLIVDALRAYRRPVFVYLPPGCELRGGAWVVIDSQINAEHIEMYADTTAQGGVLEPSGIVEIKFRVPELIALMHRIDPVIAQLKSEKGIDGHTAIKAREKALLPVYHQVALQFAQMHDGPTRMFAKGVLQSVVPWATSRGYFAKRLRRKLCEEALIKHISAADSAIDRVEARKLIQSWFSTTSGHQHLGLPTTPDGFSQDARWNDDAAFMDWAESSSGASRIAVELKSLRTVKAARAVMELAVTAEGTEGLVRGLQEAMVDNPSLLLHLRSLCK